MPKLSGEKPEVCQGILEHYQPRFAGDAMPASEPGRVVSIADKLDAIVGAFQYRNSAHRIPRSLCP